MPTLSIIAPVYKVEKNIHRCIDSILRQTYSDFELILVDDGSPDSCGAICDEYAHMDDRVIVIHKDNGGIASARNAGLDIAVGKWILFCDSDDCYNKNNLSEFLSYINLKDYDTLYGFNFLNVWPDGIEYSLKYPESQMRFMSFEDNISFICSKQSHSTIGYAIWDKLYSKKIIDQFHIRVLERDVMGNKDDWAEDLTFNLQYFMAIQMLQVSEIPVYLLSKHGAQVEQNENELLGRLNHMSKIFLQLKKTAVYQKPEIAEQFWKIVIWHLRRYFYLDVGAKGVIILREECVESLYWNQLLSWICTALEHWDEIEDCWDVVDRNDYRFLLEYLRDGNIFIYKIKNYWIWKIKPGIQNVIRRK